MSRNNYLDYLDHKDLDVLYRFRGSGNWSDERVFPKHFLILVTEWERRNWWEEDLIRNDYYEGIFEAELEDLDEYGVKSIDEINPHFAGSFYDFSLEEEE